MRSRPLFLALAAGASLSATAAAQPTEGLAPYFGFQEPRFVKVDDGCGPTVVGDFNGDGRPDLAVVNNRKSRIELYYLRAAKRTVEELQREVKVNELPPNPWYDRELLSVAHRVTALAAADVDGDTKLDLVYAGMNPSELVVLNQAKSAKFEVLAKQRVRDLAAWQDGLAIGDVMGDAAPEILAMVGDKINVFPVSRTGRFGEPAVLGSGDKIRAVHVEDLSGDGRTDVLAVVPDDSSPLRIWLQSQDPRQKDKAGLLAAELRFEMPQIREAQPARFPGRAAASIGVIERASQRVVFYDLGAHDVRPGAGAGDGSIMEREIQAEVTAFSDTGSKSRSVALADTSGDGMLDLLTNDQKANAIMVYRQQKDIGLSQGEPYSAFKQPKQIDTGKWFDSPVPQVFMLSEEERAVGIAPIEGGRIGFPKPIPFKASAATPVVMKLADTAPPTLAVILKDKRDYVLELHQRDGDGKSGEWTANVASIPLKDVRRDPAAIIPYDFDRDGAMDLLILTPGEPMMMVHCQDEHGRLSPTKVMTRETIPQFGLVQAAGPENTALLDADGDGKLELLIADANYVRFCAYDDQRGWRVVDQVNMPDPSSQLVGLSLMPVSGGSAAPEVRIVAGDKANSRLVILARNEAGRWVPRERIRLVGFPVGAVRAGSFAGDGQPGILCLSDDAFALVRLGGQRPRLEEFAAFRSDSENRVEHNLAIGDLNGDGYLDAVVLDAREAMCQILTFSASRKLFQATEFKVFESRLFQRGDSRELEPSDAIIGDMTGDKRDDLLLQVHDRVIVYPQMAPE